MGKELVTGGAGFIGSHLAERLIEMGHKVIVIDNLSVGKKENLSRVLDNPLFEFRKIDIVKGDIEVAFEDVERVWHLAANSDVRGGERNTGSHLNQNVIGTYRVLESMKKAKIKNIIFTSSSTVYGEEARRPTSESFGPLKPCSLYGASKNASESFVSSYSYSFGITSWIYRFANVIGPRSTHGVIYDFVRKLRNDPSKLEILGDGEQEKSYVHVNDCIDAFLKGLEGKDKVNIFNVGSEDTIKVKEIAEIVSREMGLKPDFSYTGGKRGWIGDVPRMHLAIDSLKSLGWSPKMNSSEAVLATVRELL